MSNQGIEIINSWDGLLAVTNAVDARRAVRKGAELLDAERPGWAELIDLDTFDLLSPYNCILGQVFAADVMADRPGPVSGYGYGIGLLFPDWGDDPDQGDRTDDADYGFNLGGLPRDMLEDAWRDAIAERVTG